MKHFWNGDTIRKRSLLGKRLSYGRGFTIVELLIVIVVIGILAAIVIVAFNGVADTAKNTSAIAELRQWHKLYETYKATYGNYPAMADGSYCLGAGFPNGYCRDINGPALYAHAESTGVPIMTELAKVGTPPTSSSKHVVVGVAGPWVVYNAGYIALYTVIKTDSATDCPSGMQPGHYEPSGGRLHCEIVFNQ